MKKFVAILMALMFSLSLGVAFAQEKAPAPAAGEKMEQKDVKKAKKAKKAKKEKKEKKEKAEAATPATPATK